MIVRFHGTRGSLPAPLSGAAVRHKLRVALRRASGRSFDSEADVDAFLLHFGAYAGFPRASAVATTLARVVEERTAT